MSVTLSVSASAGRPAPWHASVLTDGRRMTTCPSSADSALAFRNEHLYGDLTQTDADKFNAVFAPSVATYNEKQTRADRKMGSESSRPERQKSYYDGVMDGTFCTGTGKLQETAVEEFVLQIGESDDNGVTDSGFNRKHWRALKKSGKEKEASAYALAHLTRSETTERTRRILRRTTNRIINLDPEHLVVLRADLNGDEPCGTDHVHIAFLLRATGYKNGMPERVGSVKALSQMGLHNSREKGYGIVQLYEKFRSILEEEMVADALEYGYEPIRRKAPTGEKRQHSETAVFREMMEKKDELESVAEDQERTAEQQSQTARRQTAKDKEQSDTAAEQEETAKRQAAKDREQAMRDANYAEVRRIVLDFLHSLGNDRMDYGTWGEILDALQAATAGYTRKADTRAMEKAEAVCQEKMKALDAKMESAEQTKQEAEQAKKLYTKSKRHFDIRFEQLAQIPVQFQEWAKSTKTIAGVKDGQVLRKTIYELWTEHIAHIRQGIPGSPEMSKILQWADKGLRDGNGGLGS